MYKTKYIALKKVFFCFLFTFTSLGSFAQNRSFQGDFWDHVRFGGGIGLGFGNDSFNASLAPSALYRFNEQFATGVGLNFNYAKFNDNKLLAYGGSILSLFNPIPYLQLSGEFEQLRINRSFPFPVSDNMEENFWSPALFLGVGYSDGNVTLGVRYDVLYDVDRSIYTNAWMPFVRVYF